MSTYDRLAILDAFGIGRPPPARIHLTLEGEIAAMIQAEIDNTHDAETRMAEIGDISPPPAKMTMVHAVRQIMAAGWEAWRDEQGELRAALDEQIEAAEDGKL